MWAWCDEDTGETIACPFCGAKEECEHFLAALDRTFSDVVSGYLYNHMGALDDWILKVCRHYRKTGRVPEFAEFELEPPEPGEGDDDPDVCDEYFVLLKSVLFAAGAEGYGGSVDDGGGPGCSSAVDLLFAENPERVVADAVEILREACE